MVTEELEQRVNVIETLTQAVAELEVFIDSDKDRQIKEMRQLLQDVVEDTRDQFNA